MIKAIILDVDSVIIGEKIGYNSPHPHADVVATLANGTDKLKELVREKGEGKYVISKDSVDENGLLEILKHFSL